MTTVIINTRSNEAKKMLEFLKTTRYARVVEENVPNEETIEAMQEVEAGYVKSHQSAKELLSTLKGASGV